MQGAAEKTEGAAEPAEPSDVPKTSVMSSPNKICAPKPGAQATKRKWGDEKKFVVAARALQIDSARRGYESHDVCQVQNGRLVRICDVFGTSRSQASRTSDGSTWLPLRKIAQRSLKLPTDASPPALKTTDLAVSLWQFGDLGPAAYLPSSLAISSWQPLSKFPKDLMPVRRPFLVVLPVDGDDKASERDLANLEKHLTSSEQGALIRVRSMEAVACASDSISTFRTSSDEVLLLVPPEHPKVKWEIQNPKIEASVCLLGFFVTQSSEGEGNTC
ncbi:hypothetical protein GUITHDRAFT_161704 [Guillardia theta CCMP2712]|uniref:Uncharacterized protein n=1 Tax=Guillardia theta (strain CCMP2712) TaxID=905079 RepID=L1JR40_GUITC|nr:hypothetical protein GUITHDRAFT_161704 [Guillardia theta CCMP2712]EKX50749.1 hypothetical protein GUITHDRAFT_161704 [Guillardia theta CCMP2712]|eukprot:XP_005837729.1 hypothetical protein GUITHDRAFT_161704 [Guillardia theta CCMP2712]